MKKIPVFLTVFLLFLTFFNLSVNAEDNLIDIGLFYGSNAKESVRIVKDGVAFDVSAFDVAEEVEYIPEATISVEGKEYRGSIVLKKDSQGMLTVINRVDMEHYIASVTAVEMSPSFGIEALKAQAVCARTYAMRNMGKHKKYGFDLCSTVDCQAYKGVSAECDESIVAAQETAGEYMTYEGEIIQAVYSATSGGWTEDVKNVWGSDFPYLAAAEDLYESKDVYGSSWTKTITSEKATEIMEDKEYGLGDITNIEVTKSNERGVVLELKVTGTDGTKTFKRESCRLAFGNVVLSQAFTVKPIYSDRWKAKPLYTLKNREIKGKVQVLSGNGIKEIELDNITLLGTEKRRYATITEDAPVEGYEFNGRGYGHLVGMSQNGANGMAKAGFTYDEILKHYYKGIDIN